MDSSFLLTIVAAAVGFFLLLATLFFLFYSKLRFHQAKITTASSSLSPLSLPSSFPHNWKHHVFPSFHGADVRKAFLSHILKEFRSKGIDPFIDNNIERSKSIGPELIDAIRGSRIAIVLLSRNYASSTWCLNELVEIMKCREELCQTVMAIFYEVDPTDVKKQTGYFGKVFAKTCKGKPKDDIERWRHALEEVAKIAGYHSNNWDNEADMIQVIATDVSNKLFNSTRSRDFDGLVGMIAHKEKIEQILRPDLDEVRMIGILGPPGIGKTTIARFLYNHYCKEFQLSVFVENIKARYAIPPCSDKYGVKLNLQKQFLSQIFNHQLGIEIPHLGIVKDMLNHKKVFVVLDDVDQLEQLEAMANETCWFGPWSRIIITTRDQKLLRARGINHIYKVGFPSSDEALEMFCMYAFSQKYPKDGFTDLALKVTDLAGKLPLGLQVMGSYLHGMTKDEWSVELPMLQAHLNGEIEGILKFSYDALCDEDKDLFLHIACLFNGEEVEKVVEYLKKSFLYVRERLHFLADKSLISIDGGIINMHSLLAQLGEEIVRKQSVHEPGRRQFLVDSEDIHEVLTNHTADTRTIIGIDFWWWGESYISERAFEGMSSLQFLRSRSYFGLSKWPSYISPKLRLLHWEHCPMTSLSFIDRLEFLVELRMQSSKLEKLWDIIKPLRNLKWMDLSYSSNLKELPNISTTPILKKLHLRICSSLVELFSSVENSTNLQHLDLNGCSSILELPSDIGNATNLQILDLSDCSSLVELPISVGNATNLNKLYLSGCSKLLKLPSSIGNATNLQTLDLNNCSSLLKLPSSIRNATNLQKLDLCDCSSLVELSSSIGNATSLQHLNLVRCSRLVELPYDIGNATNLQELNLVRCSRLVELPSSIGNAINLQKLYLSGCSSLVELPSSIGNATNLQKLYLSGCSSLLKLPYAIGNATNLQNLDLSNCSSLVEVPSSIGNATNLQTLNLRECSSLVELPSSIGNITNLKKLNLRSCSSLLKLNFSIRNENNLQNLDFFGCSSLVELPSSIGNATNLQELDFFGCSSLVKLPYSIGNATNLQKLDFFGCSSLVELPSSIGNATNLTYLHLNRCSNLLKLPSSIGNAMNLQILVLINCSSMVELPYSIGNATNLKNLSLEGCSSLVELPYSIGNATNLQYLDLSHCSSLVELPSSIGNLHRLYKLNLCSCSKLEVLPTLVKLISLTTLDLSYCSLLKSFPEISTNIEYLNLIGTSIEEVASLIKSCYSLKEFRMSYSENLKEFQYALDSITEFHLRDTEIQEIGPWVKGCSRLRGLILNQMQKLVSISELPDSLLILDADNCESLERLDCSFSNPGIELKFLNCFKLNQDARNLIIQTSTSKVVVLPGGEVPAYFTFRSSGSSLTVKLNENTSTRFRACVVLVSESKIFGPFTLECHITSKENACTQYSVEWLEKQIFSEHLYIYDVEAEEMTSTELDFMFELKSDDRISIKECGILQLLQVHVDEDHDSFRDVCLKKKSFRDGDEYSEHSVEFS